MIALHVNSPCPPSPLTEMDASDEEIARIVSTHRGQLTDEDYEDPNEEPDYDWLETPTEPPEVVRDAPFGPYTIESVAYHEAGHAVAGFLTSNGGLDVRRVCMVPGPDRLAYVTFDNPRWPTFITGRRLTERDVRRFGRVIASVQIVRALAGPAAEALIRGRSALGDVGTKHWFRDIREAWRRGDFDDRCDMAIAERAVDHLSDLDGTDHFIEERAGWAMELMATPRVWDVVHYLAARLQPGGLYEGRTIGRWIQHRWGPVDYGVPVNELGRRWRQRLLP